MPELNGYFIIENLDPNSEYELKISYKQKLPNDNEVFAPSLKISTTSVVIDSSMCNALQCLDNSFEIISLHVIENVNITIVYNLKLKTILPPGLLFKDYMACCVDALKFTLYKNGYIVEQFYKYTDKGHVSFVNLRSLTEYEIKVSYKQKSPNTNEIFMPSIIIKTLEPILNIETSTSTSTTSTKHTTNTVIISTNNNKPNGAASTFGLINVMNCLIFCLLQRLFV